MRQLTKPAKMALIILALGMAAAILAETHNFKARRELGMRSRVELKPPTSSEGDVLLDWQKIDMDGKAIFYIPADLRPVIKDTGYLYRAFRNDKMEVLMYYRGNEGATCIASRNERLVTRAKITRTIVDGRAATLENIEKISFGLTDDKPLLKGFVMCVPDVGDGQHEFIIVGKYQSEQDHQILQRIIGSIKFSEATQ